MDEKIIKKLKKKFYKNGEIIQALHENNLNNKIVYDSIIKECSVHALDMIGLEMSKNVSFAATITGTSGLEYTRAALDEIRKELNI